MSKEIKTISCYLCDQTFNTENAEDLESNGWEPYRPHGWICPECIQERKERDGTEK